MMVSRLIGATAAALVAAWACPQAPSKQLPAPQAPAKSYPAPRPPAPGQELSGRPGSGHTAKSYPAASSSRSDQELSGRRPGRSFQDVPGRPGPGRTGQELSGRSGPGRTGQGLSRGRQTRAPDLRELQPRWARRRFTDSHWQQLS